MMTCLYAQYLYVPELFGPMKLCKNFVTHTAIHYAFAFFLKDLLLRFIIYLSSLDFHVYYVNFIITLQMKIWCSIFPLHLFTFTHNHMYIYWCTVYIFGFLLLNECSSASCKPVVSCVTQRLDCLYSWIQSNYGYACYIYLNNSQNNIKYRLYAFSFLYTWYLRHLFSWHHPVISRKLPAEQWLVLAKTALSILISHVVM